MKFSIRDLLLVTVIVALAVALATVGIRIAPLRSKVDRLEFDRRVLKEELERFGYQVMPDEYGIDVKTPEGVYIRHTFAAAAPPRTLPNSSAPVPKLPKD